MKHYLNSNQTMRLESLGFPAPKSVSKLSLDWDMDTVPTFDYSIGELIEMLQNDDAMSIAIEFDGFKWYIDWDSFNPIKQAANVELIDALFDMVVKLKEEGKI